MMKNNKKLLTQDIEARFKVEKNALPKLRKKKPFQWTSVFMVFITLFLAFVILLGIIGPLIGIYG